MRLRRLVIALLIGGAAAGVMAPAAMADFIVNEAEVTAQRGDDGAVTADVSLINPTDRPITLPTPTTQAGSCSVEYEETQLPPLATSAVTLLLGPGCLPADGSVPKIRVDLDGDSGDRAVVTVTSPSAATDWAPLVWAIPIALYGALVVVLGTDEQRIHAAKALRDGRSEHERQYEAFKERLSAWEAANPPVSFSFNPLPPSQYGWSDRVERLDAGWSFSDSWVSSVTAVTAGIVTLVTSTEAFSAFLGAAPETLLGVMATAGLISAILLGVANATVKLMGDPTSEVTVGGLMVSSAIIAAAALVQVGTITIGAASAVEATWLRVVIGTAGFLVGMAALAYVLRTIQALIAQGAKTHVPVIPADAPSAWACDEEWQRELMADSLVREYEPLLSRTTGMPATMESARSLYRPAWLGPRPPEAPRASMV